MIGAWSAYHYQGQTCITAGRHIVARPLYDRYVEALAERAAAITVGDPTDDGVGLGPMINETQRDRAQAMLDAAVAGGRDGRRGRHRRRALLPPDGRRRRPARLRPVARGDLRPGRAGRSRSTPTRRRSRSSTTRRYGLVNGVVTRRPRRAASASPSAAARGMVHVNDSTLPGRGARAVRRPRRLRPRRPRRRRGEPRGVHRDALDQRPARPGRVPVLMPDPDVLIVGAGPSGAVAAKRLAEDGFRVTVLEQGDWPDYAKARPERADFDITATRDWTWDPNARGGKADYPIDDSESDITALMWNGVGGGTIVYAAQWQRNMPSDFRVRTLDGDRRRLAAHLRGPRALLRARRAGLRRLRRRRATPRSRPARGRRCRPSRSAPPAARSRARTTSSAGTGGRRRTRSRRARYGTAQPVRAARRLPEGVQGPREGHGRHHALAGRPAPRRRADHQGHGARDHDRARTGSPPARSTSTTRAPSTRCAPASSSSPRTAIGTPRLLLLSGGDRHPDGLANSSGMVGKRLMMHPFGTVVGLFEDDARELAGPVGPVAALARVLRDRRRRAGSCAARSGGCSRPARRSR